jgi:predicted RecB family nuclease
MADFVVRLYDGSYEVVDTKLARHARPAHVLQLCFYTEEVARIQGRFPGAMHVVTGTGERESFRPDDYMAYYRRLRQRFLAAVAAAPTPTPTRSSTAGSRTSSRSASGNGMRTTTSFSSRAWRARRWRSSRPPASPRSRA